MNSSATVTCPVCGSGNVQIFFAMTNIPVHCNVLLATASEALNVPRGNMQLGSCTACGHLYNYAFTPNLMSYTQAYENSLDFSPRFQRYAEELATGLIGRYSLHGKTIIEIGCGKGDFLKLMCDLGENRGIGFDESYQPDLKNERERFTVIQDFYSEKYSHYNADFVCCRHVLEHINSPRDFISNIRKSVGRRMDCALYFEVPNALYTLKELGIWDLIYEHCSYFTANSLSRLFTLSGFAVTKLEEQFGGQFLGIEALPSNDENPKWNTQIEPETITTLVSAFAESYRTKVEMWKHTLEQLKKEGKRVVVWGSGSKGVTFLNVLKQTANVRYVVDINPRKQGMCVAGTAQQIVAPAFLREYKPDVVIVMNTIYEDEIRQMLHAEGLQAELLLA